MLSADKLGKQFVPISGMTECSDWAESKLFEFLKIFLKEFFEKSNAEKYLQTTKNHEKLPSMQLINQLVKVLTQVCCPTSTVSKLIKMNCLHKFL